jgi:hypothetical protein
MANLRINNAVWTGEGMLKSFPPTFTTLLPASGAFKVSAEGVVVVVVPPPPQAERNSPSTSAAAHGVVMRDVIVGKSICKSLGRS